MGAVIWYIGLVISVLGILLATMPSGSSWPFRIGVVVVIVGLVVSLPGYWHGVQWLWRAWIGAW